VQELLGHSSPATTAIYTQWAQDKAAGVVAAVGPTAAYSQKSADQAVRLLD
jgi:site-specific recombinase XerC